MANKYLEKTLSTPQGNIHYEVGTGKGQIPVVFLHPFGTNHTVFDPMRDALNRENYSTISLDHRGHGKSFHSDNPDNYTLDTLVQDVEDLRNAENAKKLILIGYGDSSLIAQKYAAKHPDQVKALALLSPLRQGKRNQLRGAKSLLNWAATPFVNGREDYYPDFTDNRFRDMSVLGRGLDSYLCHDPDTVKSMLAYLKAMQDWETTSTGLSIGDTPTLLVHGSTTRNFRDAYRLKQEIRGAKDPLYLEFPDHTLLFHTYNHVKADDPVTARVLEFLKKDVRYNLKPAPKRKKPAPTAPATPGKKKGTGKSKKPTPVAGPRPSPTTPASAPTPGTSPVTPTPASPPIPTGPVIVKGEFEGTISGLSPEQIAVD